MAGSAALGIAAGFGAGWLSCCPSTGTPRPTQREHRGPERALVRLAARVYVRDALKRWVPGAQLVAFAVEQDGPQFMLRLRVRERETTAAVDVTVEW